MATQNNGATITKLNGNVVHYSAEDGKIHRAKQGETIQEGDMVVLTEGSAEARSVNGAVQSLISNVPYNFDPESNTLYQENYLKDLIAWRMSNGEDPSSLLDLLEATAAGEEAQGEGGDIIITTFMNNLGQVAAGYTTTVDGLLYPN